MSNGDDADITLDALLLPNEITVDNFLKTMKSSFISEDGKIFFIENQCVLPKKCFLNGSAAEPVLFDRFKTSPTTDRNENEWIFVAYSAIHFGGEYVLTLSFFCCFTVRQNDGIGHTQCEHFGNLSN